MKICHNNLKFLYELSVPTDSKSWHRISCLVGHKREIRLLGIDHWPAEPLDHHRMTSSIW